MFHSLMFLYWSHLMRAFGDPWFFGIAGLIILGLAIEKGFRR